MEKHFVTFCSPGTFVSEETTKEVTAWDIDEALEIANGIKERHNATPYGFRFHTRSFGTWRRTALIASSPIPIRGNLPLPCGRTM